MNINELRIGNLVHEMVLGDCPVVGITAAIDDDGMVWLDKDNLHYHINSDNIEPIPLTGEWLIKFEFENFMEGRYSRMIYPDRVGSFKRLVIILNEIGYYTAITWPNISNDVHVIAWHLYVHQLQNLYFTLTGEELTIKKEGIEL